MTPAQKQKLEDLRDVYAERSSSAASRLDFVGALLNQTRTDAINEVMRVLTQGTTPK